MEAPFWNSITPYIEVRKMRRIKDSFKTPLDVRVKDSGKRFLLLNQFTYVWRGIDGKPLEITVPKWFDTDFASIPRFAKIVIPKLGRYNKAAVVHDYLYQHHHLNVDENYVYLFDRILADTVFRDAMMDSGVKPWKYNLMYWAVRLGGWLAWKKRK